MIVNFDDNANQDMSVCYYYNAKRRTRRIITPNPSRNLSASVYVDNAFRFSKTCRPDLSRFSSPDVLLDRSTSNNSAMWQSTADRGGEKMRFGTSSELSVEIYRIIRLRSGSDRVAKLPISNHMRIRIRN